ncbi:MAG: serine hydrolase [Gemmatimonadales bacterium]
MRRHKLVPLLGLLVAAACSSAPTPDPNEAMVAAVTSGLRRPVVVTGEPEAVATLADRMAHYNVPGVSIAVVDSGRIVWARGFGLKETGTADSVTDSTLFQAASMSKPVAATGMLRLVEEGTLALDAPVNTFLKSWQVPENQFTAKEKVTLRRLVSHSAGLTVHGFPGYAAGDTIPTVPQILAGVRPANTGEVKPDIIPGSRWRYSGGGTTVLQLAMMDATGEAFPALMKRLVLDPMGMTQSTYEQPLPAALAGREAAAHSGDGSLVAGRWHTYPEMAAAGLWTTPTDLMHWAIGVAGARAGTSTGVLSKDMASQMLTVQKAPSGLGPALNGSGRAFRFGHGGSNRGFRGNMVYFPETGQGAAVMSNSDNGGALVQEVLNAIAKVYQWPEYGPREVARVAKDSTALAAYVGRYATEVPQPVSATVSVEGSTAYIEIPGFVTRNELIFIETNKAIFTDGLEITFVPDPKGAITAIELGGMTIRRVP